MYIVYTQGAMWLWHQWRDKLGKIKRDDDLMITAIAVYVTQSLIVINVELQCPK